MYKMRTQARIGLINFPTSVQLIIAIQIFIIKLTSSPVILSHFPDLLDLRQRYKAKKKNKQKYRKQGVLLLIETHIYNHFQIFSIGETNTLYIQPLL